MLQRMRKQRGNTSERRKPIERQVAFLEFKALERG